MGKGGAQKPASEPRQVQELGRVCLRRKLYIFAFVFYWNLLCFLIKKVILSHLSMTKNVYLPNLYRAWSGHGSNSAGIHFLLNCQQQPGKWDDECQTRERCSPADASQAARCPVWQEADCSEMFLQGGRNKMLLMQEKLQPLRPNNCVQETFVMSNMQFLTWGLKIMKDRYYSFCSLFLWGLEYLEGVWGRKAFVHPLQLFPQLEWGWCKTNKNT